MLPPVDPLQTHLTPRPPIEAPVCAGVSPGVALVASTFAASLSGALVATSGSLMIVGLKILNGRDVLACGGRLPIVRRGRWGVGRSRGGVD